METNITINNNEGIVKAFEEEKQVGQIDFTITDSVLSIEHTRTFEGSEGKGVAGALVAAATDYAIENNGSITNRVGNPSLAPPLRNRPYT